MTARMDDLDKSERAYEARLDKTLSQIRTGAVGDKSQIGAIGASRFAGYDAAMNKKSYLTYNRSNGSFSFRHEDRRQNDRRPDVSHCPCC